MMAKSGIRAAVGSLALLVSLTVAACGSPAAGTGPAAAPAEGAAPTQAAPAGTALISRESGGNAAITVTVRQAGDQLLDQPGIGPDLSGMKGRVLPFAIALDTHDGDISKLDLNGKVFLRDASGTELPAMVKQLSTSSHHTTYAAAFPSMDSSGKPLDDPAQGSLQILIRGVGQMQERVLEWTP
ncbi:MAG TPA: hypothetical protein VD902_22635 [Symbiobacteriaceae bacterium]|nr:hypothetical protein [Symbiobacteriaceae bacterium]